MTRSTPQIKATAKLGVKLKSTEIIKATPMGASFIREFGYTSCRVSRHSSGWLSGNVPGLIMGAFR